MSTHATLSPPRATGTLRSNHVSGHPSHTRSQGSMNYAAGLGMGKTVEICGLASLSRISIAVRVKKGRLYL